MVTVLEHEFYLSEILDRRVFVKKHRIGRLSDLAIVETDKLPEVTHVIVSRPYGHLPLTVPWDRVLLISNEEIVLDISEESMGQFEGAPQAHRSRRAGVLHAIGEAVVSSAAEHSSRCFLAYTAPLLEEKRDFRCLTLFPNRKNPLLFHRTRPWATFPADYHPRDSPKREFADILQQRLN